MDEVQRAQVLRAWKEGLAKPAWCDAKQALELVIREGGQ